MTLKLAQQPEPEPAAERLPQAFAPHQEHDEDRDSETECGQLADAFVSAIEW
jgi:hypothetical protein